MNKLKGWSGVMAMQYRRKGGVFNLAARSTVYSPVRELRRALAPPAGQVADLGLTTSQQQTRASKQPAERQETLPKWNSPEPEVALQTLLSSTQLCQRCSAGFASNKILAPRGLPNHQSPLFLLLDHNCQDWLGWSSSFAKPSTFPIHYRATVQIIWTMGK